eukprot:scaffold278_cov195-Amphora_coffeaeformis.AAC.20
MAKGVPKKVKKGTPPPVDKLLKPAIGVALALVAYQFMRGLGSGIARISLINEVELREVLYGDSTSGSSSSSNNNYVVLCQSEESTAPISSVFQDAYKEKSTTATIFRVMDCQATIPSTGKSVVEEFQIDMKQRPTIFVSGPTLPKPTQVPEKHLKTGTMLNKYLRAKLEKHAVKIETTQDLRTKCLSKDVCALLLKGGKKAPSHIKDAVSKLLKEYPDVTLASVDTSVLYVLHLEEYLPEFQKDTARFVVFRKVSGSMQTTSDGGGRLITSMTAADHASYGPMSNAVAQVLQKTATMQKLSSLPQIKTRTKKLEESERAKRQRKAEQKKRQAESSSSSSSSSSSGGAGGGSGDGDDMKEERRRERERRRAEHNAAHNVKPKTPEEIAEMERKRRERMEQEAAKWNVAPDDAPPPEGDAGGSYTFDEDDYDDEEENYVVVEDVVDSDQDDEDVIDLD